METISVLRLKTQLSAELKHIEGGLVLMVVDHNRPVAMLSPVRAESLYARELSKRYAYKPLAPLIDEDPLALLGEERKASW